MANEEQEHEGASPQELLIEACRRNNTDLLTQVLADRPDAEITRLLNTTMTVMGNHLYHEAASRGNYEVIDLLLDQPDFECDPTTRRDGDTPLHAAVRHLNAASPPQPDFAAALVSMMLDAGSDPRRRNRAGLTPAQLVDPANAPLRRLIDSHLYASQNAGDFVNAPATPGAAPTGAPTSAAPPPPPGNAPPLPGSAAPGLPVDEEFDDEAEFSGSDEEERAEWERRKQERVKR